MGRSDRCATLATVASTDHTLLPSQKADVFRAIEAAGFDPAEFDWKIRPGEATHFGPGHDTMYVPMLIHAPSGWYFVFDFDLDRLSHHAIYSPGNQSPESHSAPGGWGGELVRVGRWLGYVRRELAAPDLWAEVGRQRQLLALPRPETENAPFTEDERRLISEQLRGLKELLESRYDLQDEQMDEVSARLGELEDAATRLGRLDWGRIMVAELVGLFVRSVIPDGAFREAGRFLVQTIGHLVGLDGVPELPGGPPEIT